MSGEAKDSGSMSGRQNGVGQNAGGQDIADQNASGQNGGGHRISTLGNGMRVVSDSMDTVETVSLGVWVGVGTRNEEPEVNGIAHLLEHMAFKGTARRSAVQIAEEIEAVGGHLNAYTSRENTAYYAKVLKDDAALAVDLIADILQNAQLDGGELERERNVVLQEIAQAHDTPDDIIFDHFQSAAFPGQPLGQPILGSADIVRQLTRDHLSAYLQTNYGASTMVLSAAGNIAHEALVDMAETAFGTVPANGWPGPDPAAYRGGDTREARDLEQLHLIVGFPGLGYHDKDFYAESVLSTLLGGGMSSRLFREIREQRGLVYSIYSFTSFYDDTGLFGIYAGTGGDNADELIPVLCDQVASLTDTLTEAEVERARTQLKASLLMGLESTMSRCEQIGQQMLVFGRPLTVAELVERVSAVDIDAVRRVARPIFSAKPTIAALGQIGGLEPYDRIAQRLS